MTTDQQTITSRIPQQERPRWQMLGRLILELHLVLAGVWWWMMPGGFPVSHPRFWVNQILPWFLFLVACMGLYANRKQSWGLYHATLVGLAAMWTSALLTGIVLFPISAPRFFVYPLILVLLLIGFCLKTISKAWLTNRLILLTMVLMLMVGAALPLSQRGGISSTHPVDGTIPTIETPDEIGSVDPLVQLGKKVVVSKFSGSVETRCGRINLVIQPLLTFQSRSPDRCWSIFAPPVANQLRSPFKATVNETDCKIIYDGQGTHFLRVQAEKSSASVSIEAFTQLEAPVYSHLNSYSELMMIGHRRLSVVFSPCPETPIEFLHADYPAGHPMQAAYVDRDRNFHIVKATTGEKGPFTVLASGKLPAVQPLTLTFLDDQQAFCRVELRDWSSQVSTALSPTAGWGFPEGAIEFSLSGDTPDSPANVWFTLAGTSVGRGWDSVGHATGLYRNRMKVISLDEKSDATE